MCVAEGGGGVIEKHRANAQRGPTFHAQILVSARIDEGEVTYDVKKTGMRFIHPAMSCRSHIISQARALTTNGVYWSLG